MAVLGIQGAVVFYIGRTLYTQGARLAELPLLEPAFLLLVAVAAIVYAASLVLAALAWTGLVAGFSFHAVRWRDGLWVYGQTVTAKYLPGNVFHFVGRQFLGIRLGWSQSSIALATLVEAFMLLSAASALALIASAWSDVAVRAGIPLELYVLAAGAGTAAPWAIIAGGRIPRLRRILARLPLGGAQIDPRPCLWSFLAFVLFLLVSATLIWTLVAALSHRVWWGDFSALLGAYGLIFLAGYVLPGAPAGLGVREALLILLLGPALGVNIVTAGAISFRVATITGEVVFFLATLRLRPAAPPAPS